MIIKMGSYFILKSKDGRKTLGRFKTKEEAVKRLQEIQFFKHKGEKK